MRPAHHADDTRTLFQNPWNIVETDAAPPTGNTGPQGRTVRRAFTLPLPALPSLPAISDIPLEFARAHPAHPHPPVKVVKPDWGATKSSGRPEPSVKATWLGHASFLVEFPGTSSSDGEEPPRVLFDPIFSNRAGPSPWVGVHRRLPPPCTVEQLPTVHFVVYSHNHYDHLDLPTLQSIYSWRGTGVHFIIPLGNKAWFLETGIPASQVTEMDWWDTLTLPVAPRSSQHLKFVCTPAQHTSGRGFMDTRTTLWASWVVEQSLPLPDGADARVSAYFAGDSGYMTTNGPCPIFEDIGERYGPFDVAMLPIWRGGTLSFIARLGLRLLETPKSFLTALHATPAQALRMHGALRSRHTLAMHFATFAGSDIEAFDPIVELEQAKELIGRETGEDGKSASVGEWWEEGGMGVIDVGETAVISCAGGEGARDR
ncbi:Metallo-hydrolase/oxidoreductase [Auriscalpium vulgare]|uniref:Metallo-hydrolase/oxidoreductase n=1 Tax=Auriscalpium vulgare TaxID=40419 RepID=A0ACB8RGU4_9AGAM|nr:Metallo-hydrolase/oxidoreductase [Auriscalpium vulgare]